MRNGKECFETTSVYMDFLDKANSTPTCLSPQSRSCGCGIPIADLRNWETETLTQV